MLLHLLCIYKMKLLYSIVVFVSHTILLDEIVLQSPIMQCKSVAYAKNGGKIFEYFSR